MPEQTVPEIFESASLSGNGTVQCVNLLCSFCVWEQRLSVAQRHISPSWKMSLCFRIEVTL